MEFVMAIDVPLDKIRIKEIAPINIAGGAKFDDDGKALEEPFPIKAGITAGITALPEIKLCAKLDPVMIGINELPDIKLCAKLDPIKIGITELPDIKLCAKLDPIKIGITELPKIDLNAKIEPLKLTTDSVLNSDSQVDLNLDVRISELPQIDLQLGLRPMRFHLPLSYEFCLKIFGIKVFEFKTCGEGMFIVEDYKAKSTEKCD
jgi:hypothetical protein